MKSDSLVLVAAAFASRAAAQLGGGGPPLRPAQVPPEMLSLDDFPWVNPFKHAEIGKFTPACESTKTFQAAEFLLDDLQDEPPKGVGPYFTVLKDVFSGRQYPGIWDGYDPHGYDRSILQMEYADVPLRVREWIEEEERSDGKGKGLYVVFDKPAEGKEAEAVAIPPNPEDTDKLKRAAADAKRVVLFAPGAMYSLLPLWAAEESSCEGK